MADAERLDPALLTQCQRDEKPQLHKLGIGEMLVQLSPQSVVGNVGIPDDRAGVSQRDFFALAETRRALEFEEIVVLLFAQSFPPSLDGSLDPSVLAVDRL